MADDTALDAVIAFSERLAHDANNYIGAILGLSEVLPIVADDPEQVALIAARIAAAGRLLQVAINQPLLPHAPILRPRRLNFDEAERVVRSIAASLPPKQVAFDIRRPPDEVEIGISMTEFSTLVFVLLRNAADAIGNASGHIRVSMTSTTAAEASGEDEDVYWRGTPPDGRYLALSVIDDGCGFPTTDASLLFQPFFSRSRRKSALGLGLNFASAILEGRQGAMAVSRGAETRFTAFIPLLAASDQKQPSDVPEDARIIVVDPLAQWGNVAATLLSALDRAAICVVSIDAAIELLSKASSVRHVVVLHTARGEAQGDALKRLGEAFTRRMNIDLLIVVGAAFPADQDSAVLLGDMAAIFLGADAEPADLANYLIPNM